MRNEAEVNAYLHQQVKLTEKELDELNAKFHPVPPPKIPRTCSWDSVIAGTLLFGAAGTMIYLIIAVCQLLYKLFGG